MVLNITVFDSFPGRVCNFVSVFIIEFVKLRTSDRENDARLWIRRSMGRSWMKLDWGHLEKSLSKETPDVFPTCVDDYE